MGLPSSEEVRDVGGFIEAQQESDGSFAVNMESLKASATSVGEAHTTDIDTATGEIITTYLTSESHAPAAQDDGVNDGAPTFDDAIKAAKSGSFDIARDIAIGFNEGQKKEIEETIAKQKNVSPRRPRAGMGIE